MGNCGGPVVNAAHTRPVVNAHCMGGADAAAPEAAQASPSQAFEIVGPMSIDYESVADTFMSIGLYFIVSYVALSAIRNVVEVPVLSTLPILDNVRDAALITAVAGPYALQMLAGAVGSGGDKPTATTFIVVAGLMALAFTGRANQAINMVSSRFTPEGFFSVANTMPAQVPLMM